MRYWFCGVSFFSVCLSVSIFEKYSFHIFFKLDLEFHLHSRKDLKIFFQEGTGTLKFKGELGPLRTPWLHFVSLLWLNVWNQGYTEFRHGIINIEGKVSRDLQLILFTLLCHFMAALLQNFFQSYFHCARCSSHRLHSKRFTSFTWAFSFSHVTVVNSTNCNTWAIKHLLKYFLEGRRRLNTALERYE